MPKPVYFGGCSFALQSHDVSWAKADAQVGISNDPHDHPELSENTEFEVRQPIVCSVMLN